ncbi:unnamed protein product [Spirodela intermedia]|uniref:Retroviral polymerase SH3-like domain-containing protein n=1 Tax=Spirodela intermedia TaxID=51605 RepID=A0A7I8IGM9_SPIIN|nr:unnamed protein product [Spirodela intermedia]CAA6656454.1 unnamed protein product [Spirodela intermedia]
MSGSRTAFTELDTAVLGRCGSATTRWRGSKAGGNRVPVQERRAPVLRGGVLHSRLTTNIVSVGQLDEAGYHIDIEKGAMKPAVHHLKVFGCIAYVLNTTPHLKKQLEDRGRKMIFIGYECGSKAYRAYDPTTRRVHVTRDVVFDENAQWDWGSGAEQGNAGSHDDMFTLEYAVGNQVPPELDGAIEVLDDDAPGPELMSPPSVHSSGRAVPIEDGGEEVEFATPPNVHIDHLDANHDDVPLRFRKIDDIVGLASPRGLAWRKAMEEEMASIEENRIWSLVDLPHSRRAIRLKWVYKVKRDENGAVAKYKACWW